jgi:GrpB-like predicted nucleotidyltransferase (UPF0157 family)
VITVSEYDPTWPAQFATIEHELRGILAGVDVLAIEHVGSTSVPGLAAKPVIDVDIVVARDSVPAAIEAMERGGYVHLGEMGIEDRHAFRPPGGPKRNVYVTVDGCRSLRNHLGVREVLRNDAALREEYASLKKRLAQQYTADEIDEYVEGKSVVLQRILAAAGIADDERAEIEQDNRAVKTASEASDATDAALQKKHGRA